MTLRIVKPGMLTTVQDLGRFGYQRFGVNPNGAMDRAAARIANLLVGNQENAAVIETHFPAFEAVFERETVAAIAGADFSAEIDGIPIAAWSTVHAREGSTLRFRAKTLGNRAYLAVQGGFEANIWLGSASTNLVAELGGYEGRKLAAGDRVHSASSRCDLRALHRRASPTLVPLYRSFPTVRVVAGAEFSHLDDVSQKALIEHDFVVSTRSDRMGFRLDGQALSRNDESEIVSSAVTCGTIQLLPDGSTILLMADHQTTGGYPRLAHVITRDLPLAAQLGPGDKIAFHIVDIEHAEALAAEFELDLAKFRVATGSR